MRNNYLKKITTFDKNYFEILTDHLIDYALILTKLRKKYINKINEKCDLIYENLTSIKKFNIKYISNYGELTTKEEIKTLYKEIENQEIKYNVTLIGPQKDDLEFYIDDKNIRNYGSQGQQRMAVLALKLSELEIIKEIKNNVPILLLDDVLSELDIEKQNKLLSYIKNNSQVLITTTDLKNINEQILKKSKKIHIKDGKVTRKGDKYE